MTENQVKLSVYGILIDSNNKILMQKRANTPYASGWWSFPGGHVESEEPIIAALVREIYEEGGIEVNPEKCTLILTLARKPHSGTRYINFFYVIKEWVGTPIISDGKASELAFFSVNDLPDPILPYIQEAMQLIHNKVQFYESAY